MRRISLLLGFLLSLNLAFSQTGPGGIGSGDGSVGPRNVLWLRADAGVTQSGTVSAWVDQSGNGFIAAQTNPSLQPSFSAVNPILNGLSSMNFLPGAAANYHLAIPDDNLLDDSPGMSFFLVLNPSSNGVQGVLNKRTGAGANQAYRFYRNSGNFTTDISDGGSSTISLTNAPNILSSVYDQTLSGNKYNVYVNSTSSTSSNVTTTLPNENAPLYIGNFNLGDNRSFDGDIAEIIIYNEALNAAERIIVENYLANKYNISITTNDFYSPSDAAFLNDLTGIGTTDGIAKNSLSGFSDALQIQELNNSLDGTDEFIFIAHDNTAHSDNVIADLGEPEITDRWARSWYLDNSGNSSTELRFDFGTAGLGPIGASTDYVLLYRPNTSSSYTRALVNGYTIENTDQLVIDASNSNLPSGYYTIGRGTQLIPGNVYSFQSGPWNDPLTWTTDPSGLLRIPGAGLLPSSSDNVTILSGDVVSMTTDNNDAVNLEVNGELNIGTTSGHDFFNISGSGIISLAGDVSNNDNFPTGSTSLFADPIVGGTVVVNGTGVNLDQARLYNNLVIDLTSTSDIVTQLADYTINGDFTISNGIFRINDNSAITSLSITVQGDTQISSNAEINVGNANARHEFNFYGDFQNNGIAEFTNRGAPNYTTEATDGIVDANFLSGSKNQTIDCFGVTNFYRIEIDKGTDQTYILDINASDAANFNLFGAADYDHGSIAQLVTNDNALGLLRGTVRINPNVDVPFLNTSVNNYNISESARLWVNGGSVEKTDGTAIVPYGTIQVSAGILNVLVNSGITTRGNGNIIVEGGVVTVNQIRTSTNGPTNIGGYTQSGGIVNVTGNTISTSYYAFSLTYPGNTFNMSGGTLNVSGAPTGATTGGIFIASSTSNQNVTGGTVVMEINRNNDFKVTSLAPFWNVIVRHTSGTGSQVDLIDGTSGTGGSATNITNPDLRVLNNLTIEADVMFDHNGFDVEIGGDFSIDDNAAQVGNNKGYIYDVAKPNTTTFNGVNDSFIYVGQSVETGYELFLTNMVVNKPADKTVILTGDPAKEAGNVATSWFARLLQVTGDFRLESGILNQGEHAIRLFGTAYISSTGVLAVYEAGVTETNATIVFRGDGLIINTEAGAQIGNFNMDVATPATQEIGFSSDVKVIRMGYIDGKINLGENNLTIDYLHDGTSTNRLLINDTGITNSGGAFYTSGKASDGGLSLLIDDNSAVAGRDFDFPVGVSGKYTPASVAITNFSDDGYITITPVNKPLNTLNNAPNNILQYYWDISYSEFSNVPDFQLSLEYDQVDVDGAEPAYVPGRIINSITREEDTGTGANVDGTNNIIDFSVLTLQEGQYTAGSSSAFNGSVRVLWSINDGEWHDFSNWSTTEDGSSPLNNAGQLPGANDIVVIGRSTGTDAARNHHVSICDGIGDNCAATNYAPITVAQVSILRRGGGESSILSIDETAGVHDLGIVTVINPTNPTNGDDASKFVVAGPTLPAGDFGEFTSAPNAIFAYTRRFPGNVTNARNIPGVGFTTIPSYTIGNSITEYPGLQIEFSDRAGGSITLPDVDITVNRELSFYGNSYLIFNTGAGGDVAVKGDFDFRTDNVILEFPATGNTRTLTMESDMDFGDENNLLVQVEDGGDGSLTHLIRLQGSMINISNSSDLSLFRDQAKTAVNLEYFGDGNSTMNAFTVIPELNQLLVNKNIVTDEVEVLSDINLGASTNGSTKAINLQKGILKLNNSGITANLTTGGDDFSIPSGSTLQLTLGTVSASGDDSGILLDGSLIIDGGIVDLDDAVGNGNNYIEYSSSGNAILDVSAGVLDVGSQIRPNTTANTGILKYRQTGGDVRIGTQTGPESTRGMLQIYNVGSEFTYTGGTLTIERHQTSPSIAALYLDPDVHDLTGSTITVFNGNTPAGQSNFGINSTIPLNNLVINGNNSPTAITRVNALEIEGDLTINFGATLNANGIGLSLYGDFINDGTFTPANNTTAFVASGTQSILGSGTNAFYNLTKDNAGSLELDNSITINGFFIHNAGAISDLGNTIDIKGNAVLEGNHSSAGGEGLKFSGSSSQQLFRSSAGTSDLGIVTITNSNGVTIPSGNGYNFNINGGLRLDGGVFDIGGSNILFSETADIVPLQPFSVSNMIKTNSSFADKGVGKVFTAGTTTDFTFPMGQSFYTPAIFDFSSGSNTSGTSLGTIFISPANEYHPTINDGTDATPGGDINNVLQYYWTIRAETITGFTSDVTFGYNDALVSAVDGTEADYIAARILSFDNPTSAINKYTTAEVDETSNLISFTFSGDDSNGITGDYFAGIDAAIPPTVITYIVANQLGNQDITNTLTYDASTPLPTDGVPPTGAVIIVPTGTTLRLNEDNIRLYRTEIQSGAVVEVADGFTNHRLGILEGTGDLRIVSNGINANLPAFSGTFLSCSGGGLEYAGTGSYSIMSGISEVRNLSLTGSGVRNLANNDITICENFIINDAIPGLIFNNVNNRNINVDNDLIITSGTFNAGTGTVDINNDLVVNGGTYNNNSGGITDVVNNLTISAGTFNAGTGGQVLLNGDLSFAGGSFNGGSSAASVEFRGASVQDITGDFTGGDSFYRLRMLGSGIRLNNDIEIDNRLTLNNGLINGNGNTVTLGSGITVSPSNSGQSNSYVNGRVIKTLTSIGSSFTFPIGSALLWRPAKVQNVSIGGLTWEAQYFQASPTVEALVDNLTPTNSGQIATISDGEYWKISDGNGTPSGVTAIIGLSWGIESDVSIIPNIREDLQVMAWNDAVSSWDNYGGINFSGGNTQSEGTFDASSVMSFSENIITLGSSDPANPLPVELLNFEAKPRETTVELYWQTASEINNDYFTLLRSKDGDYFEQIAVIAGAGQSSSILDYEYFDERPYSGLSYYKLMQTDFDGTEVDLGIVLVKMENSDGALTITAYPNPFGAEPININIAGLNSNESTELVLIDQFGKYIYSQKVQADDSGYLDVEIKSSQSWNSGLYIIRLITEKGLLQNKVIKY